MPRGNVELKKTPKGNELKMELGKSLRNKFGSIYPAKEGTISPITQVKEVKEHKTLVSYFRASLIYIQYTLSYEQSLRKNGRTSSAFILF